MKILFVSPTGSLDNGAEIASVNVMAYLARLGHDIYNVYPVSSAENASVYTKAMAEHGIKTFPLSSGLWWWAEAPNVFYQPSTIEFAKVQTTISKIRTYLRQEQIDLVVSNTVNVFAGALSAALENVRHFWLIHEFPYGEFAYYRDKFPLIESLSDAIFAVEGELYQTLLALMSDRQKLHAFKPYSDVAIRELVEATEGRIVSIGKLTPRKNQLELLSAYAQLKEAPPLVFIGGWDEAYKAELDAFIADVQLETVSFLGHQQDPWRLVTQKDVMVLSSQLETFHLVYVEAILNGVPVLVSDNPGHRSVHSIFKVGNLYPLGNQEELQSGLEDLLQSFEGQKASALLATDSARELYTIEHASHNLVAALTTVPRNDKPLAALSPFLGADFSDYTNRYSSTAPISIFFIKEDGLAKVTDMTQMVLEERGKLLIPFSSEVKKLRLDFSEEPSYVRLSNNTKLFAMESNGFKYQGGYLFTEPDPQLMIDVSHFQSGKLVLEYQYQSLLTEEGVSLLAHYLSEVKDSQRQVENRYNAVVNSRRWRYPTLLLNLIKGKND